MRQAEAHETEETGGDLETLGMLLSPASLERSGLYLSSQLRLMGEGDRLTSS